MSTTSRRHLLAAVAASAASVPLAGLAVAPASAADPAVPVQPLAVPNGLAAGARSAVTLPPLSASYFVLPGPQRTFAENKRLFVDDFQRTLPDLTLPEASRAYWGTSPGGGGWSTVGGVDTDFSVVPGAGKIALTSENVSRHASLRDGEIADVDVRAVAAFDKVPAGEACSYALSFGYQDTHNNYRARLSFLTTGAVQLRVEKEVADVVTQLAPSVTLATGVGAGTRWTIRVRREGSVIQVKAWASASAEPSAWAVEVGDATFGKGRVGLRALAGTGCTNLPVTLAVSRFQVDAANWDVPPSVTHDDWVRVLPQPFDGSWTREVERTVRGWVGSTAPDVLAYAAMFLGGVPAVTAGAGPAQGKQVLGEAGYGYLDPHGLRYEGADFHEYMNVGWTFDDGVHTGPSSKQVGNLDCSGYARMVYGYHFGVPMAAGEDTTGLRIPRKSRHMADHCPGVRVDRTDGTNPPAAALLQPGDLVLFNADSGDDKPDSPTVTVDHVGIYLGLDAAGKRRFLSSRKTVNGPTMGDLGGASLLDGTGTYATTLHTVHRV
ncbi:MAG: hypothetical protein JF621_25115 [Streptomyces turgidiscabies]|nr:hypothetical protein [Streptomyces turgidiscabies]